MALHARLSETEDASDASEGVSVPASATTRVVESVTTTTTLSKRLWDLDWSRELPWTFEGIQLELGTFDEALAFMQEHYASIFGVAHDRFFAEEMSRAKRRFWAEMDIFAIRYEERTIGICAGHPTDWSTYYIRTHALLPEFRERRFSIELARFQQRFLRAAGVTRWEAECSVANVAMIRLLSSEGCLITSSLNSDRWGAMLRFTKFLREDAEAAFRRQFIYVPAFGRNPTPQ